MKTSILTKLTSQLLWAKRLQPTTHIKTYIKCLNFIINDIENIEDKSHNLDTRMYTSRISYLQEELKLTRRRTIARARIETEICTLESVVLDLSKGFGIKGEVPSTKKWRLSSSVLGSLPRVVTINM